ncbi:MAG: UDP-N-acetylmuramoyl-tripeptide--D-alanyl-D-alanine ligase [Lachnospiraceae bacterium]|nr:UDP-N-acetylmuramoyl-tripeptide--D-alanyl-D-alanine ligase [Lachnospiraceae bacterium]
MKNLTLHNLAEACRGRLFNAEHDICESEVAEIVTDSRKVVKNSLFIAIRGERVDGHDFIDGCYEAGAVCVISEKKLQTEKPYILVERSLQAIKDIAEFYLKGLNCKVVGITGSVGKTSTKEMIASVLGEKYQVLKTEGNFNNELGLPLTVFRIREEHEVAVLEMGISDFGEMSRLAQIAKPDISVITNIGLCHLENLKTRDGILQAKTEMFNYLKEDAAIILNGDDDKLSAIKDYNGIVPVFYGIEQKELMDVYADSITPEGIRGIRCNIRDREHMNLDIMIQIPGRHMVYNALAAACVGRQLGLKPEEIRRGIEKILPVSGRNHIISVDGITLIDDCYNANPVSMKASIDVLSYAETRKVAILGDMFELGANEAEFHSELGDYIGAQEIDVVVLAGRRMKHAYLKLHEANENYNLYYFEKTDDLIQELDQIIRQGDTVLVKASHGMNFIKIIRHFTKKS